MKKLEDIVLKKGDIVEFVDGNICAINGLDGVKASSSYFREKVKSIKRPVQCETIYEAQHEILDKEEKEWLEHFLKPFEDSIEYIEKKSNGAVGEYLYIQLDYDDICLPYFESGTMYKDMEVNKKYTLEELGLFE